MTDAQLRQEVYAMTCDGCKEGAPLRDGGHVYIPRNIKQILPDIKECTANHKLADWVIERLREARLDELREIEHRHDEREWLNVSRFLDKRILELQEAAAKEPSR